MLGAALKPVKTAIPASKNRETGRARGDAEKITGEFVAAKGLSP